MKTLILLRHAKAEAHGAKANDHDRSLTPKGVKAAAVMGAHLAAQGLAPDLILSSDAVRARETLDALMTTLKANPTIEIEPSFYPGRPDLILARIRKTDDRFGCVMVIAHNPGLEDLARALVRRPGPGEEWGVVVQGSLELTVGDRVELLGPGEGYYFESSRPHRFRNVGDDELVIVSANTPPSF